MKLNKFEIRLCFREAIKVSLVVGTTLSLINQSHLLSQGVHSFGDVAKIFMNYVVPFSVATYSRIALLKEQHKIQQMRN